MNEQPHRTARRRVAVLGCLAILFQAILFGWHHHDLMLSSAGVQPVVHSRGTAPLSPATAEDGCDICQVLHHLTGAPWGIVALSPPTTTVSIVHAPAAIRVDPATERAFRAHAPPRA